jgi:hypothetical protein
MRRFWFFRGIGFFFLAAGFVLLGGYVVMHLWNWLIPAIFNSPIGWRQAIGILILGRIIFGGFGHRRGCWGGGWGHHRHWHGDWRQKMEKRMADMSPEERERFKQNLKERWRGRCGDWYDEKFDGEGKSNTSESGNQ